MRPWWLTYTTSNYIATSRAPFNPMEYVFRTVGLSRGAHPYGFVIDDLRKDGADHLYEWCGMLSGGVCQANVADAPKGSLVLGYDRSKDSVKNGITTIARQEAQPGQVSNTPANTPLMTPSKGDPLLLVLPISPEDRVDSSPPPIRVETAQGPLDKNGIPQPYDRLVISKRAKEGHFKVLLIPYRMGEPMPSVSFDGKSVTTALTWDDQKDLITFDQGTDGKTSIAVTREGKPVVASAPTNR
jgi:hypothetical protein